jgi:uncharacterized membrane protein YoaK (UPF0700 family)
VSCDGARQAARVSLGKKADWGRSRMPVKTFFAEYGPKLAVALLLTFASGVVDIVGYVGVYHFFTAHLTGTTVQLGHGLADRDWTNVSVAGAIVCAFVCGSILGRVLIEAGSRRRIRRVASVTLAIEAVMLIVVALSGGKAGTKPYWSLGFLAAAMGIQTATLTGVGPLTVHTTFVTGMLNKLAQLVSHIAFRAYDSFKSKSCLAAVRSGQQRDIQMTVFLACIWLFYVGGAAAGTWSFSVWALESLFVAVALLAIALAVDQFWPLSIREEQEQSER